MAALTQFVARKPRGAGLWHWRDSIDTVFAECAAARGAGPVEAIAAAAAAEFAEAEAGAGGGCHVDAQLFCARASLTIACAVAEADGRCRYCWLPPGAECICAAVAACATRAGQGR